MAFLDDYRKSILQQGNLAFGEMEKRARIGMAASGGLQGAYKANIGGFAAKQGASIGMMMANAMRDIENAKMQSEERDKQRAFQKEDREDRQSYQSDMWDKQRKAQLQDSNPFSLRNIGGSLLNVGLSAATGGLSSVLGAATGMIKPAGGFLKNFGQGAFKAMGGTDEIGAEKQQQQYMSILQSMLNKGGDSNTFKLKSLLPTLGLGGVNNSLTKGIQNKLRRPNGLPSFFEPTGDFWTDLYGFAEDTDKFQY